METDDTLDAEMQPATSDAPQPSTPDVPQPSTSEAPQPSTSDAPRRKRMRIDSDEEECDQPIPFKIRKVSETLIDVLFFFQKYS